MPIVLSVAVGGALGSITRYGLDTLLERRIESSFPFSTLAVNASGCLAVGFVIAALVDRHHTPLWLRSGLVVGFCGGFTTFSTFAQETLELAETSASGLGLANVVLSVGIGVLAVLAGTKLGRAV